MDRSKDQGIEVRRYIGKFSIVYIVGTIGFAIVFGLLDVDGNFGLSIGLLMVSAMYAVGQFIKEQKRLPSELEKSSMIWGSLGVSWLLSILFTSLSTILLAAMGEKSEISGYFGELGLFYAIVVIFFTSLLYIGLLSWCYGGLAKKQFAALEKKGKI